MSITMDRKLEKTPPALPLGLAKTADTSVTDLAASPTPSSPASFDGDSRRFSFQSIKSRARRSLSIRGSVATDAPARRQSMSAIAHARTQSLSSNARKLSKSHRGSSASSFTPLAPFTQRVSGLSDDSSDTSSLVPSSSSSSSGIDWQAQIVEGLVVEDVDTESVRPKPTLLAVTSEYLVKLKCRADALGLFPGLAKDTDTEPVTPNPSPLLVIPLSDVVSVFAAEGSRPSFGLEVWWRTPSGDSFRDACFWFKYPVDREEYRRLISRKVKASRKDTGVWQPPPDILDHLQSIHQLLEPAFAQRQVKVFPVVPRGTTRRLFSGEAEERQKKEKPSFWLIFGEYLCHVVAVQRAKSGEFKSQRKSYGFVSLERIRGDFDSREERFNLVFRVPCSERVVVELSSRFFNRIIFGFGNTDSLLKPAWPPVWQLNELFQVPGLGDARFVAQKDDFGSIRRTLDAYLAAYRCSQVDWEINWKTKFAPEFRLLPAKDGSQYTTYQILAVLRALRYNDYFNSLSFKDVDLSPLWGVYDLMSSGKGQVAYMNRSCLTLSSHELQELMQAPVLHQEFHALAFCSETIRQIDFTRSAARFSKNKRGEDEPTKLEFLTPILMLLRTGSTKCSHLLLSGNILRKQDVEEIAETLSTAAIQALDVSSCGLDENDLEILTKPAQLTDKVQLLDISKNLDRLPVTHLPNLLLGLVGVKELNLRGSLRAGMDVVETLFPFRLIQNLQKLEVLDISGLKINPATLDHLSQYIRHRADIDGGMSQPKFRKLSMDHCGLSGAAVAKFCSDIGDSADMTLSISGNPLDEGLDKLCDAIRRGRAPSGLIMEMVSFRHETGFINLIEALTENKSVSLLSLAGTSTLEIPDEPCSKRLIQALHNFFAYNTSIQYLDLSGYSGKLEDGQFAKGFARSLSGLLSNKTISHLKIRNQTLNGDDIALIGRVLAENRALRVVDCQDNGINLTGIRFLVSSVKANTRVVDFPFSPVERRRILGHIVDDMRRNSYGGLAKSTKKNLATEKVKAETKAILEEMFTATFQELDACLQRNRAALRKASGQ
ncbi:protein NLRC3, partial [Podospora conica]